MYYFKGRPVVMKSTAMAFFWVFVVVFVCLPTFVRGNDLRKYRYDLGARDDTGGQCVTRVLTTASTCFTTTESRSFDVAPTEGPPTEGADIITETAPAVTTNVTVKQTTTSIITKAITITAANKTRNAMSSTGDLAARRIRRSDPTGFSFSDSQASTPACTSMSTITRTVYPCTETFTMTMNFTRVPFFRPVILTTITPTETSTTLIEYIDTQTAQVTVFVDPFVGKGVPPQEPTSTSVPIELPLSNSETPTEPVSLTPTPDSETTPSNPDTPTTPTTPPEFFTPPPFFTFTIPPGNQQEPNTEMPTKFVLTEEATTSFTNLAGVIVATTQTTLNTLNIEIPTKFVLTEEATTTFTNSAGVIVTTTETSLNTPNMKLATEFVLTEKATTSFTNSAGAIVTMTETTLSTSQKWNMEISTGFVLTEKATTTFTNSAGAIVTMTETTLSTSKGVVTVPASGYANSKTDLGKTHQGTNIPQVQSKTGDADSGATRRVIDGSLLFSLTIIVGELLVVLQL